MKYDFLFKIAKLLWGIAKATGIIEILEQYVNEKSPLKMTLDVDMDIISFKPIKYTLLSHGNIYAKK